MGSKHTPGPWEAVGNLVRSPMNQPEGLPRGVQIAECRDGYFLPHTDEAKANARLIAAAPDLLEALKYILTRTDIRVIYETAEAAIAKAEGSAE